MDAVTELDWNTAAALLDQAQRHAFADRAETERLSLRPCAGAVRARTRIGVPYLAKTAGGD